MQQRSALTTTMLQKECIQKLIHSANNNIQKVNLDDLKEKSEEFIDMMKSTKECIVDYVHKLPTRQRQNYVVSAFCVQIFLFLFLQVWTHEHLSPDTTIGSTSHIRQRQLLSDAEPFPFLFYNTVDELKDRKSRFPSIEERLKVYMSTWYVPPCQDNTNGFIEFSHVQDEDSDGSNTWLLVKELQEHKNDNAQALLEIKSKPHFGSDIFYLRDENIRNCTDIMCTDAIDYLLPALQRMVENNDDVIVSNEDEENDRPIIVHFDEKERWSATNAITGQTEIYPIVPVLQRYRYSMTKDEIHHVTTEECYDNSRLLAINSQSTKPYSQGIITISSDYDSSSELLSSIPELDKTPWNKKKNVAIWRGTMNDKIQSKTSADQLCHHTPRCHFVQKHINSTLIDAKMVVSSTEAISNNNNDKNSVAKAYLETTELFDHQPMDNVDMLKYKAIIWIEGEDSSSYDDLSMALFSSSVVLMKEPTRTTWLMEELLEPWVHYIPIANDLSDIEEKVQWIINNDEKARQIGHNSQLWVADLIFHPESKKDNEHIIDQMLQRYQSHFQYNPILSNYISLV